MDTFKIEDCEKLLSEKRIKFEKTIDQKLLARLDHRDDHGHTYQKLEIYTNKEGVVRANFLELGGEWKHDQDPVEMIKEFHWQKICFFSEN